MLVSTFQWVYNVLNKEAEADKVIYDDSDAQNGFLLANDIKWNGKDIDTLYVLAIINRHGVKSIRFVPILWFLLNQFQRSHCC